MPKYTIDPADIIFEEDAVSMLKNAKTPEEKALVCLAWLFGPRPAEAVGYLPKDETEQTTPSLSKSQIRFDADKLSVTFRTLKLRKTKSFQVKDRILEVTRPTGLESNLFVETLINFMANAPEQGPILPYTTRWAEKVINRLGEQTIGKKISPYHFRHSCFSWMAINGKTPFEIMYWKGARSLASVMIYVHLKPQLMELQKMRRSKEPPKAEPTTDKDFVSEIKATPSG